MKYIITLSIIILIFIVFVLLNRSSEQELVKIEILEAGTGDLAEKGNTLVLHYRGALEDGTEFDSSYNRNEPFSFVLGQGQVIQGWEQGVLGMREGEKRKLIIAPELGYGRTGAGNIIPPNATLIFEVDLLEIK